MWSQKIDIFLNKSLNQRQDFLPAVKLRTPEHSGVGLAALDCFGLPQKEFPRHNMISYPLNIKLQTKTGIYNGNT